MSHLTLVLTSAIVNLEVLSKAVRRMGFELLENDFCRYYFGKKRKDYVIRLPGKFDAAIVEMEDGTYRIEADWDGDHVAKYIGRDGEILLKYYAVELAKSEAIKRGYSVSERQEGAAIVVTARDSDGSALHIECLGSGTFRCQPEHIVGEACMKYYELEKALGDIQEHHKTSAFWGGQSSLEKLRVQGRYLCG
ncbi:hypothetical protein GJ688_08650 [Heliobacillus mobilis]|uniref:Uncharacterized protein n=1 Tax=Heliobacterium mobile TaxID=28064 RepID=A0A6I3SJQ7_HELMO|nr:hypothetical protein [Heliobacterium mobile]MTV49046.1 hypothetical protein [Heliobacterium mobile]